MSLQCIKSFLFFPNEGRTNPKRLLNEVCLLFQASAQEKGLTLEEALFNLPERV